MSGPEYRGVQQAADGLLAITQCGILAGDPGSIDSVAKLAVNVINWADGSVRVSVIFSLGVD